MISKALVAASTKPMILSILLGGENYGYQIIQRAKKISGGTSSGKGWTCDIPMENLRRRPLPKILQPDRPGKKGTGG